MSTEEFKEKEKNDLLRELSQDDALYDVRNWRKQGITPEEIRLRYEQPELQAHPFDKDVAETHFPNVSGSRLFGFIFPRLKHLGVPTEKIIEIVMSQKVERLRKWADYLRNDHDSRCRKWLDEKIEIPRKHNIIQGESTKGSSRFGSTQLS